MVSSRWVIQKLVIALNFLYQWVILHWRLWGAQNRIVVSTIHLIINSQVSKVLHHLWYFISFGLFRHEKLRASPNGWINVFLAISVLLAWLIQKQSLFASLRMVLPNTLNIYFDSTMVWLAHWFLSSGCLIFKAYTLKIVTFLTIIDHNIIMLDRHFRILEKWIFLYTCGHETRNIFYLGWGSFAQWRLVSNAYTK